MKRMALRALYATLFAGGLTLLGAGVAHASETGGDDGIVSGTQAGISIDLPITLGGNAISLIGDSSSSDSSAEVAAGDASEPAAVTSGDDGIGSGTQALIDVEVPITIGGNAVSVVGDSSSEDAATSSAPAAEPSGDAGGAANTETGGDDSLLGGTQGLIDLDVPITLGGNAISVIGDSSSSGAATEVATGGSTGGSGEAVTSGEDSLLGGTQILGGIEIPITLGGNAVSVIGDSSSDGAATTAATGGSDGGEATTSGDDSLLGGTQLLPELGLPITLGGNAISGIGDSTSTDAETVVQPGTGG
ncbi:hypothetical protein, partial [Agromyces lapidis]